MTSRSTSRPQANPFDPQVLRPSRRRQEVAPGVHHFVGYGFGTASAALTGDGWVVIDTGGNPRAAADIRQELRGLSDRPVRYVIYTHGHIDHCPGAEALLDEGAQVIAHENVPLRFDRYLMLEEHTKLINSIQFRVDLSGVRFRFIYPHITYSRDEAFELGGRRFELFHGKGETDDATVVWLPDARAAFVGDFFTWVFPNVGNPLKIVRYEKEWFETLERVRDLDPAVLVPGHGRAITDRRELRAALRDWIDVLRLIHAGVVEHLNRGATLEETVAGVRLPRRLQESRFLNPAYGSLEFAITNVYRRYSGWIDFDAAKLSPAPRAEVAALLMDAVGDEGRLLDTARRLQAEGRLQHALEVIDVLAHGRPANREAHAIRAEILDALAAASGNLIARDVYLWAADGARKAAGG